MDKDLLAAARDLKFQDPKRFAELATQYPELAAEATKPRITKDGAGTGSPKGYEPYRTWSLGPDRGRWFRTSGSSSDIDSGGDDSEHLGAWASAPAELHERSLLDLHLSTDGGYTVTKSGTRSNQLEVCRLCGNPLKLSRDAEGYAYRDRGKQPEYCGPDCRKAVKEARARAKRAANRPRTGGSKADRIARRYGTGGTPPAPVLTPGWDRVVTFWRFPKRNPAPAYRLTSTADHVWRIDAHANY